MYLEQQLSQIAQQIETLTLTIRRLEQAVLQPKPVDTEYSGVAAAKFLGCTPQHIIRLVAEGTLIPTKPRRGTRPVYKESDLLACYRLKNMKGGEAASIINRQLN